MKKLTPLFYALIFVGFANGLMAQDRSYYTLGIQNIAPTNITFTNNSNLEVKVILYYTTDIAMAAGFTSFNIQPGGSHKYTNGVYHVKVFKPQLIDHFLFFQKNVSGDFVMSGTQDKFKAERKSSRKNTEFKNQTGESIRICLYDRNDNVKTIPLTCYDLKDNTSTASYNGDHRSFFVSVFHPAILDRLLVSQICPDQSSITVNKVK